MPSVTALAYHSSDFCSRQGALDAFWVLEEETHPKPLSYCSLLCRRLLCANKQEVKPPLRNGRNRLVIVSGSSGIAQRVDESRCSHSVLFWVVTGTYPTRSDPILSKPRKIKQRIVDDAVVNAPGAAGAAVGTPVPEHDARYGAGRPDRRRDGAIRQKSREVKKMYCISF